MLSFYKKKVAGWNWYDLPEVISTNDTIKELSEKDLPAVVSAAKQSGGRGRRGRRWQAVSGNLYFTFSQSIPVSELSRYVCIIGLSMAKVIKKTAPKANIKLKWPNDVFLNGKKVTGILLENIKNNIWAIGIGVNIVGSPDIKDMPYQATSLKEEGIDTERTAFLEQYLEQFSSDLAQYEKEGFEPLRTEWLKFALNLGQEITIKNDEDIKTGIFLTLDEEGYLILKIDNKEERIIAGDLFI